MNIADTKKQIAISLEQARISELKSNYWKDHGEEWKCVMYKVRMKALRCYADHLHAEIRKHEKKMYKKENA